MIWEKVAGDGIWSEYVNSETNERSLKEHTPKVVKTWCATKQHSFIVKDMPKRLAVCEKCGQELVIILGKHIIDEDKVILN